MRLILAPMATLSHEGLRRAVARFGGCDEYYTEMIHAASLLNNGPFEKFYKRLGPQPHRLVWQLTGAKSEPLIRAAELLSGLGGIGVDINMGCCAPDIYRHGAGIAWMLKDINETSTLVAGVRKMIAGTSCSRLSVKIRLGDDDFSDNTFFSFCEMLAAEGVQVITLHPRTRKEKYRLPPRWEYVERLACFLREKHYQTEVVLNGAVCDEKSFACALRAAPSAVGVMIGREAVRRPWIFALLARTNGGKLSAETVLPDRIDLYQTALDFLFDLEECQPPEFWKTRSQRFFTYYSDNVQFAQYLRNRVINSDSLDKVREELRLYFEQVPDDRFIPVSAR